jgi:BNR repeat-like domain
MTKLIISFNALIFSVLIVFYPQSSKKHTSTNDIVTCGNMSALVMAKGGDNIQLEMARTSASIFETDPTKAYSMPLFTQTPKGDVLLSWTEKNEQGMTSFCFSTSNDQGKTFSKQKTIASGYGIGNSRLMRAKLLPKKDGSLVAVFINNPNATAPAAGGRGGGRGAEVSFCVSKDNGNTWTSPQAVDTDLTKGLMRGFFDATVLANDEIAVAYLKDVKNSTKHEERDLRLAITKNGVFQPEKLIDAVVCDCCNINLLVDASGALNVYYRDNNDDIRDMAKMTSTDNGQSFSKSQIVHNDGWKINGCPHSGAVSGVHGKTALVAWFSGSQTESGIRLATQEGKKLLVLNDPTAKNQALIAGSKSSVMMWEQNQAGSDKTQLVFRKINEDKLSETLFVEGSINATNSTGLIFGNQLLVAYEVKQDNKKNKLNISTIAL